MDQEAIWYQQKWDRGTVLEKNKAKMVWDFEFHLRKTTTKRRPDLILELNIAKIWVCDMVCPQQNNIGANRAEKTTKYRQIASETKEGQSGYEVYVVPVVVGVLGGGIKALRFDLKKIFENNELLDKIIAMMQRTVLMGSESIIRRVISGFIQGEDNE